MSDQTLTRACVIATLCLVCGGATFTYWTYLGASRVEALPIALVFVAPLLILVKAARHRVTPNEKQTPPAAILPSFLRGHWSTEGGGEPVLVLTWMEGGTPMSAWVPRGTVEAVVAWRREEEMMTPEEMKDD